MAGTVDVTYGCAADQRLTAAQQIQNADSFNVCVHTPYCVHAYLSLDSALWHRSTTTRSVKYGTVKKAGMTYSCTYAEVNSLYI